MTLGPVAVHDTCQALQDLFMEKCELYDITLGEGRKLLRTFLIGMLILFQIMEDPSKEKDWDKYFVKSEDLEIPDDLSELL